MDFCVKIMHAASKKSFEMIENIDAPVRAFFLCPRASPKAPMLEYANSVLVPVQLESKFCFSSRGSSSMREADTAPQWSG